MQPLKFTFVRPMDIVSRLKQFIEYKRLPVTAFADRCGISRPSMSQLLNGRNKKVSHELIQRIHDSFPELSVLWLMFGQGDMLVEENISFSEAQNPRFSPADSHQPAHTLTDMSVDNDSISVAGQQSENSAGAVLDFGAPYTETHQPPEQSVIAEFEDQAPYYNSSAAYHDHKAQTDTVEPHQPDRTRSLDQTVTINPDRHKTIVNIIVYYSDNSFESFGPTRPS